MVLQLVDRAFGCSYLVITNLFHSMNVIWSMSPVSCRKEQRHNELIFCHNRFYYAFKQIQKTINRGFSYLESNLLCMKRFPFLTFVSFKFFDDFLHCLQEKKAKAAGASRILVAHRASPFGMKASTTPLNAICKYQRVRPVLQDAS